MRALPVVERELRVTSRHPALRWSRVAIALVAVLVVGLALLFTAAAGNRSSGGAVFRGLVLLLFLYSSLAGVFLTADCLSVEKREGTLGLLFLTDLKGYDVVLGKLAARGLWAGYGWLAVLPVMAVTIVMGGVTAGEFWRMALLLVSVLLLSLAVGLAVSAVTHGEQQAMLTTFLLMVGIHGGGPLLNAGLNWVGWSGAPWSLSPVIACLSAFDVPFRVDPSGFWEKILVVHALGLLALGLACVLLPRRWRVTGEIPDRNRAKAGRSGLGPRRCTGDPVAWLAGRTMLPSRRRLFWVFLVLGALGWLVGFGLVPGPMAFEGVGIAGGLMALVLRVLIIFQSTRFFVEARRSGAMELLLSTPLTAADVVGGQVRALRERFLGPVVVVAVVMVLPLGVSLWVRAGSGQFQEWDGFEAWAGVQFAMVAYRLLLLVTDLYAAAWLGMYLALASRNPSRAPLLTLLYVLVLPYVAFCVPRVLINLPIFFTARSRLRRDFYALVRGPLEGESKRRRGVPPPLPAPG